MNKIYIIGNLTKDPELTTTQNGINVCRFTVAVGRKFENANGMKEVDFFNVMAWRGLADNAHKYLKKGNKLCVVGSLQIHNYEGNDGVKRTKVEVVAEEIEFLTPKSAGDKYQEEEPQKPQKKAKAMKDLEQVEDDDYLPF